MVGATAVCAIVYILPVFIHLRVRAQRLRDQADKVRGELLAGEEEGGAKGHEADELASAESAASAWWSADVVVPCVVGLIGLSFSVSAMWVGLQHMIASA